MSCKEMKAAAMSFSAVICGVIVLLMAADVCGQDGWSVTYGPSICALKGSTVEMSCNYTYPARYINVQIVIEKTFWFTKEVNGNYVDLKEDTDYSGRVEYKCTEKSCTMKISNVKQTDSKEYKFRFLTNHPDGKYTGSPGVFLSVTALQVTIQRSADDPTKIQLTCHMSPTCQLPDPVSYVWLEDETPITTENNNLFLSSFNTSHRYQCAIKGYDHVPSPAVYAPLNTVLLVTPSETVEGSSVTLTCSSDAKPAAKYNIYRVNEGQHGQLIRTETQSVFSSIQVSDTGRYYCTAENDLGSQTSPSININVKYAPQVPSVSISPSGDIMEGNSVTLTCSSDANPAASYTWYKENKIIHTGLKVYHVVAVSSEHRGRYICKAQNQHGEQNSSALFLDVLYAPQVPSVSISPSGDIMEGNSVTLTCSSDANPAANYSWYKENKIILTGSKVYHFVAVGFEHRGNYFCKAQNQHGERNSSSLFLDVFCQSMSSITSRLALLILISMLVLITSIRTLKALKKPTKLSDPEEIMEMRNVIEIT